MKFVLTGVPERRAFIASPIFNHTRHPSTSFLPFVSGEWILAPMIWRFSCLFFLSAIISFAAEKELPGDKMLAAYFRAETDKLADACLTDIRSLEDWEARKPQYREQLFDMLGLSPLPQKSDLHATITGKIEREDFTVEKLHFQSLPGLYVTANLYLPKRGSGPAPTILYLSGHAKVFTNGISLGNKTAYQHHGIWFARNGYACLVVDTLQLGEVEGIHHGTHNKGMWWWNSRGYTATGVEAWNNIRALDYLQTRPEVDKDKIGVTGRSGGGAYSWVITALDDRIKVAVPVAGITDLENYVVDGAVEGHCDCMFHMNTFRWDYPLVAALAAPRPLLLSNSDKDRIFPLEGILRTHWKVREIYRLYNAATNLGLLITDGPHEDTQDLQVPAFRWFNRFLKKEDSTISMAAEKMFEASELKVFSTLPTDSLNARIQETFVPTAQASLAPDATKPDANRDVLVRSLREKVFAGWPQDESPSAARKIFTANSQGLDFSAYDFEPQPHVTLRAYVFRPDRREPKAIRLEVLDEQNWKEWLTAAASGFPKELTQETLLTKIKSDAAQFDTLRTEVLNNKSAYVFIAPRGVGLTSWNADDKERTHIRRRFMLLGQTLDSMRVWDIRKTINLVPALEIGNRELSIHARGTMAVNVLYAALFEEQRAKLVLHELPSSHQVGPDYLNVLRVTDIPQVLSVVKSRTAVEIGSERGD